MLHLLTRARAASCTLHSVQCQSSLEKLSTESILPESQCKFHKGVNHCMVTFMDHREIMTRKRERGGKVSCHKCSWGSGMKQSTVQLEELGEKPGWRCCPHSRAELDPHFPGYFPNNFSPNNFGIWSRLIFLSVPGTEKAMSASCDKERKASTSLAVPVGKGWWWIWKQYYGCQTFVHH